jgi:hypothetical protein
MNKRDDNELPLHILYWLGMLCAACSMYAGYVIGHL